MKVSHALVSAIRPLAIVGTLVLVTACGTPVPPKPPLTQLQVREMQTRSFDMTDDHKVQKAVLNLLQDEGFIVKNAQPNLGLLVAEKQEPIQQPDSDVNPILIGIAAAVVVAAVVIAATSGSSSSKGKAKSSTKSSTRPDNDPPPPPEPKPIANMTEITVNVTTHAKSSVVRFSAQRSVLSDRGGKLSVEQVLDAEFYQRLFSKLDKALFIERAGF